MGTRARTRDRDAATALPRDRVLIYLASYPRSGNAWVRLLVQHYLGTETASVYRETIGNLTDGRGPFWEYESSASAGTVQVRLASGCRDTLTSALRAQTGARPEPFFLKTHERPPESWQVGEAVVQIVRHPGAALWSYALFLAAHHTPQGPRIWRLLRRAMRRPHNRLPTVDEVIAGATDHGDWSVWNEAWLRAAEPLGDAHLLCRYEDLHRDHWPFVEAVAQLTGVPPCRPRGSFPAFEQWHTLNPRNFRRGQVDDWRSHLTTPQDTEVFRRHGAVMRRLGYDVAQLRRPRAAPGP